MTTEMLMRTLADSLLVAEQNLASARDAIAEFLKEKDEQPRVRKKQEATDTNLPQDSDDEVVALDDDEDEEKVFSDEEIDALKSPKKQSSNDVGEALMALLAKEAANRKIKVEATFELKGRVWAEESSGGEKHPPMLRTPEGHVPN